MSLSTMHNTQAKPRNTQYGPALRAAALTLLTGLGASGCTTNLHGHQSIQQTSATPAQDTKKSSTAAPSVQPLFFELAGKTKMPVGYYDWCNRAASNCTADKEKLTAGPIHMDVEKWVELDNINRYWNAVLTPVDDNLHYNTDEYWAIPTDGKADCEDYVLAKRNWLIKAGWPRNSLLITVVRNTNDEIHAVLSVTTDEGTMVLDNLKDDILPWTETGYTFLKSQGNDTPYQWRNIKHAAAAPKAAL